MKFKDISVYEYFSFAGIKSDGTGYILFNHMDNNPIIQDIPGLYSKICNSNIVSMGLRTNGSISAFWSSGVPSTVHSDGFQALFDNIPVGNDFVDVYVDNLIAFALKSDGSIVPWAKNNGADLDSYDKTIYTSILNTSDKFKKLYYSGQRILCGIKNDGSIGIIERTFLCDPKLDNVPIGNDFIDICAGRSTALALRSDGTLEMWGVNSDIAMLTKPSGVFKYITVSYNSYAAIRDDGSIVVWGNDDIANEYPPIGSNYKSVGIGLDFGVAITLDNDLVKWGNSGQYTINLFSEIPGTLYEHDPTLNNKFVSTSLSMSICTALTEDGLAVPWGWDYYGAISGAPTHRDFIQISSVQTSFTGLRRDGSLESWGDGYSGPISDTPKGNDFIQVSQGSDAYHAAALREDGSVVSWGSKDRDVYKNTPTEKGFIQISSGSYICSALKSDGSVVLWGNEFVEGLSPLNSDFVQISSGYSGGVGINRDGSLSSWGSVADTIGSITPEGNDFIQVSCSSRYAIALRDNGKLAMWAPRDNSGYNETLNNIIDNMPTGNDFIHVSMGVNMCAAVRSNGSVVVWGNNGSDSDDISYELLDAAPDIKNYPKLPKMDTPPTIDMDSNFSTHSEDVRVLITTSGDSEYIVNWKLVRSDGLEIFNKTSDLSLVHGIITETLKPGIDLPILDPLITEFTLTVTVIDINDLETTKQSSISVINKLPILAVDTTNSKYIKLIISDPDMDALMCTIVSNLGMSNQKTIYTIEIPNGYESDEYTPTEILYYYKPGDLVIGEPNDVTITLADNFLGMVTETITSVGEYRSIMFYNEEGELYSDDTGKILKHIEFGDLIPGDEPIIKTITMENKSSRDLRDVILHIEERYISSPDISMEISIDPNKVIWGDTLDLSNRIIYDEDILEVYIRITISSNRYQPLQNATANIHLNGSIIRSPEELAELELELG